MRKAPVAEALRSRVVHAFFGAPEKIRTPGLLIRSSTKAFSLPIGACPSSAFVGNLGCSLSCVCSSLQVR